MNSAGWRKTLVNLANYWWLVKSCHPNLTMSCEIYEKASKREFTKSQFAKSFWSEICHQSFLHQKFLLHIIWYITYLATHHEIPHSVNWWRKTLVNLVNHWWFAKCLHLNLTMSHDIKLIKKANKQEFAKVLLTKSFWWEICQSFPPTNICAIAMVYSLRWELVGDKYIALGKCYICHKTLTKSCMLSYKQI